LLVAGVLRAREVLGWQNPVRYVFVGGLGLL
jgi:hypothetical protein